MLLNLLKIYLVILHFFFVYINAFYFILHSLEEKDFFLTFISYLASYNIMKVLFIFKMALSLIYLICSEEFFFCQKKTGTVEYVIV